MTNAELVQYYTNLLIIQYRSKLKAFGTMEALLESEIIFELISAVSGGYNINTSVGDQLDIIGKYAGISRVITGTVFDRSYFHMIEYTDSPPIVNKEGFAEYGDPAPDAQFRSYIEDNESIYTLNDSEFREIIKLKIIKNSSRYSTQETDDVVFEFFGSDVIFTDRNNMTISYIFPESKKRLVEIAKSQDLIPRQMAVGVTVSFTKNTEEIFGFATYNIDAPQNITGFSEYGETTNGGWIAYE